MKSAPPYFPGEQEEFSLELSSLDAFLLIGERNAEINGGRKRKKEGGTETSFIPSNWNSAFPFR